MNNWSGGWKDGEWKCQKCGAIIGRNLRGDYPFALVDEHKEKCCLTYEAIGKSEGLEGSTLIIYVAYMMERWKNSEQQKCIDGYAREWANRFKNDIAWQCSDTYGKSVLTDLLNNNL